MSPIEKKIKLYGNLKKPHKTRKRVIDLKKCLKWLFFKNGNNNSACRNKNRFRLKRKHALAHVQKREKILENYKLVFLVLPVILFNPRKCNCARQPTFYPFTPFMRNEIRSNKVTFRNEKHIKINLENSSHQKRRGQNCGTKK